MRLGYAKIEKSHSLKKKKKAVITSLTQRKCAAGQSAPHNPLMKFLGRPLGGHRAN